MIFCSLGPQIQPSLSVMENLAKFMKKLHGVLSFSKVTNLCNEWLQQKVTITSKEFDLNTFFNLVTVLKWMIFN